MIKRAASALRTLRVVQRASNFAAWTTAVIEAHRACARLDDAIATRRGKERFIHAWSHGVFPIFGVELTVVGGETPRELPPFLVISNHRSPLDVLVSVHLTGGILLAHHGVADIPVVGYAANATDTILVNREDPRSGARAIRAMRSHLKAGHNVIAFPEGTTYPGDEVRPFKRGSFSAAKGVRGAKVLPLGIAYRAGDEFFEETFAQHLMRMARRRRTPIWAVVGEPQPVPRTAADEEALRQVVQGLVDRAAAARDAGD